MPSSKSEALGKPSFHKKVTSPPSPRANPIPSLHLLAPPSLLGGRCRLLPLLPCDAAAIHYGAFAFSTSSLPSLAGAPLLASSPRRGEGKAGQIRREVTLGQADGGGSGAPTLLKLRRGRTVGPSTSGRAAPHPCSSSAVAGGELSRCQPLMVLRGHSLSSTLWPRGGGLRRARGGSGSAARERPVDDESSAPLLWPGAAACSRARANAQA